MINNQDTENNLLDYVWLKNRVLDADSGKFVQEACLMAHASDEELEQWANHCNGMIYNIDKSHPGRAKLLDWAQDALSRCLAELFVRSIEHPSDSTKQPISRKEFYRSLFELQEKASCSGNEPIETLVSCEPQYADLSIKTVLDAALSNAGIFNRDHITLRSICKHGLRITENERTLFKNPDKKLADEIKSILHLPAGLVLKFIPTGLTYTQFRAAIKLRTARYEQLTSEQLKVLSDILLPDFISQLKQQIKTWETLLSQIREVQALRK